MRIDAATRARVKRSELGSSIVELAFILPVLSLVLLGIIDFGRFFYTSVEVTNAAHAGAQFGARTIQMANNTTGMQQAALNDAPDTAGMTATASYSCTCPNAGVVSCTTASCGASGAPVVTVTVTTQTTVSTLFPWPGIPSPITINGSASIRAR
jgi:Flp pilus assembly protein TadG